RWPVGNSELSSLASGTSLAGKDPEDPEALLYQPPPTPGTWGAYLNAGSPNNWTLVQQQLHSFAQNRNMTPVIVSGGQNNRLDTDLNNLADNGSDDILSFRLRRAGSPGGG